MILSGNFFDFVNKTGLNVCFIDKYGEKTGAFVPQNNRRNIKTELKQFRIYDSGFMCNGLCLRAKSQRLNWKN